MIIILILKISFNVVNCTQLSCKLALMRRLSTVLSASTTRFGQKNAPPTTFTAKQTAARREAVLFATKSSNSRRAKLASLLRRRNKCLEKTECFFISNDTNTRTSKQNGIKRFLMGFKDFVLNADWEEWLMVIALILLEQNVDVYIVMFEELLKRI